MDRSWWIAAGIAVFGLGLTAFLVKKMKPEVENWIVRAGVAGMFLGIAIFLGAFFVPRGRQEE
jgi:uncharacterized membrane protein YdjX (TVP38/TMEM64 family)